MPSDFLLGFIHQAKIHNKQDTNLHRLYLDPLPLLPLLFSLDIIYTDTFYVLSNIPQADNHLRQISFHACQRNFDKCVLLKAPTSQFFQFKLSPCRFLSMLSST